MYSTCYALLSNFNKFFTYVVLHGSNLSSAQGGFDFGLGFRSCSVEGDGDRTRGFTAAVADQSLRPERISRDRSLLVSECYHELLSKIVVGERWDDC